MTEEAIEVAGLTYRYPDGTAALRGVNLGVSVGETVGIVGPNGAGKTTLLLHLNGSLSPTRHSRFGDGARGTGAVRILGTEVGRNNLKQIRSEVGFVFENPEHQLFMPTVFEDVAFGPLNQGVPPEDLGPIVAQALAEVGMQGAESRSPHHLSLGQKRRVALATVLAMQPKILALDEPLAGLDPRGRRETMHLIAALPQTKVIASHDLEMILELCRRVFLLDAGEIIATGPTAQLLADQSLMEAHGLEVPVSLRVSQRPCP